RRLLDQIRRGKIREALRQVQRVVLHRQTGHLADDALGKLFDAVRNAARGDGGGGTHFCFSASAGAGWVRVTGSSWPGMSTPTKRSSLRREARNRASLCGGIS